MKLTVLGSGTCVPSLKRGGPGLLINTEQTHIVVDSGMDTLHKLLSLGLTYHDIDCLLFTHIHPDHTAELVSFLFACNYGKPERIRPLTIIGSDAFHQFMEQLHTIYGHWLQPQNYPLQLVSLQAGEQWQHADFTLKTAQMQHTPGSLAYRIETDKTGVVISGDTDYCPQIIEIASSCDLLVLECSAPDEYKVDGHLTPSLAGRIAAQAACPRLLLTHFYPTCDQFPILNQCRQTFSGEIILAEDLLEVKV